VVIHYEEALYQVYAPLPLHIFVFYSPTWKKNNIADRDWKSSPISRYARASHVDSL